MAYEYYAYAPCETGADGENNIAFNLAGQEKLTSNAGDSVKYDLLWVKGNGTPNEFLVDGKLPITFNHKLCKVKVNLKISDEFYHNNTDNPIDSVNITTSVVNGKFDALTGEIKKTSNDSILKFNRTAVEHIVETSAANGTYTTSDIFYAPGDWKFTVYIYTKDGRTYRYVHINNYTFEAGNIYTINLKMGKEVIQMGDISVEDWKDANLSDEDSKLETE